MMSLEMLFYPLYFLIAEYGNLLRGGFDIFDKTASLANFPGLNGSVKLSLLLAHRVCSSLLQALCSGLLSLFSDSRTQGEKAEVTYCLPFPCLRTELREGKANPHIWLGVAWFVHILVFKGSLMGRFQVSGAV